MKKSANDCQKIDTETVKENIRQFMKDEALTVVDLNNCASHSRYFSDELDAQFFIKIS